MIRLPPTEKWFGLDMSIGDSIQPSTQPRGLIPHRTLSPVDASLCCLAVLSRPAADHSRRSCKTLRLRISLFCTFTLIQQLQPVWCVLREHFAWRHVFCCEEAANRTESNPKYSELNRTESNQNYRIGPIRIDRSIRTEQNLLGPSIGTRPSGLGLDSSRIEPN